MSSTRQRFSLYLKERPAIARGAWVLLAVGLITGLAVGVSDITTNAVAARTADMARALAVAGDWQGRAGTRFRQATSLAITIGAFAAAGATVAPNHTSTPANRMQFINNASWARIAESLFSEVSGVLSLQLQCSGVITQIWPPNSAPVGADIFNNPVHHNNILSLIASTKAKVFGPVPLLQGGVGFLARYPVYVSDNKTFDTWWGYGAVVARITDLLASMNISQSFYDAQMDYALYYLNITNQTNLITTSNKPASDTIIRRGQTVALEVLDPDNRMYFAVLPSRGDFITTLPRAELIVAVVLGTVAGAVALVGLYYLFILILNITRHSNVPYIGRSAKQTFLCLVSLKHLASLSEKYPGYMPTYTARFESHVKALAKSTGCHVSNRLGDGCIVVVAKSPAQIWKFAQSARRVIVDRIVKDGDVAPLTIARRTGAGGDNSTGTGHNERQSYRAGSQHPDDSHDGASKVSGDSSTKNGGRAQDARLIAAKVAASLAVGTTVHVGLLLAQYNAMDDHYSFTGKPIQEAALIVDETHDDELSWTNEFRDAASVDDDVDLPKNSFMRDLDERTSFFVVEPDDTVDREDNTASRHSSKVEAKRSSNKMSKKRSTAGGGNNSKVSRRERGLGDDEGGAAAAVMALTGGIVRRRVCVVAIEFVPVKAPATPHDAAIPDFHTMLGIVDAIVQDNKGSILAVIGYRVVVGFNVVKPVSNSTHRAGHFLTDLKETVKEAGTHRYVATMVLGHAHAAVVGSSVLCMGPVVYAALDLLPRALEFRDEQNGCALVAGDAADEVRSAFAIQAIGLDGQNRVVSRLEHLWQENEDDDEWLYTLQKREEQSDYHGVNRAFAACASGNLTEAHEQLLLIDVTKVSTLGLTALRRILQGESPASKPLMPQ